MSVRPAKTRISLGIRPVWSESSLCAQWVAEDPRFLHVDSEDSDQTGRMPRLIWVFAGCTLILLVLSWRGSYINVKKKKYSSWFKSYGQFSQTACGRTHNCTNCPGTDTNWSWEDNSKLKEQEFSFLPMTHFLISLWSLSYLVRFKSYGQFSQTDLSQTDCRWTQRAIIVHALKVNVHFLRVLRLTLGRAILSFQSDRILD